jgi:hypothetical protein
VRVENFAKKVGKPGGKKQFRRWVDGWILLKWILIMCGVSFELSLAQDRDQRRDFVNAVLNLRVQ